jgi:quinone-modifying oxidoreductase subunit QmoC
MTRINSEFSSRIEKFGLRNFTACYNCGSCTAVCPLVEEADSSFPRRMLRFATLGLEEDIQKSLDPWLCYYCGDCSEKCPRQSNPGELMMFLRRYLTAFYDWTGLSRKLYNSARTHIGAMILLFAAVLVAFVVFAKIPDLTNPDVQNYLSNMSTKSVKQVTVPLNRFAPSHIIHIADYFIIGILSFFLISNVFNMYYKLIIKNKDIKIPLWLYVKEIPGAALHFITQLKFSKCERKFYWIAHLFIMSSYITMFSLIIFGLPFFQTDVIHPIYHPQRLLGYYATFGLLFSTVYFMYGRLRKNREIFKYTHHSDIIFTATLFLMALTGILIHIFRVSGMALPTYYAYALHLAFEVPFVVTFVAFSKWSHIIYRPFAIYLSNMIKGAKALQEKS